MKNWITLIEASMISASALMRTAIALMISHRVGVLRRPDAFGAACRGRRPTGLPVDRRRAGTGRQWTRATRWLKRTRLMRPSFRSADCSQAKHVVPATPDGPLTTTGVVGHQSGRLIGRRPGPRAGPKSGGGSANRGRCRRCTRVLVLPAPAQVVTAGRDPRDQTVRVVYAYAVGAVAGAKTRARRSVTRDQCPTLPAM